MEVTRTFDILDRLNAKFQKEDILAAKVNGKWEKVSTQEYAEKANIFSYAFLSLGLKKGDKDN